ncbi:MAG: sensor histidine kinase [Bacteroidia bacterium]|nr:sensor histidine kinase [Bacteroidia bacterium]
MRWNYFFGIIFGIIFGILSPCLLSAQPESKTDSLRRTFQQAQNPVQKADIFYKIAQEVEDRDLESIPLYADSLEKMATAARYPKGLFRADMLRADYFRGKMAHDTALVLYHRVLDGFQSLGDSMAIVKIYNNMARVFSDKYQPDSAIHYYLLALEILHKKGPQAEAELASAYSNIGNLYVNQITFEKGIEYLKKSVEIRLHLEDENRLIYTYNNLATAYGNNGMPDTAMFYAQKGIALAEKLGNTYVAGVLKGGMANLLNQQGKYAESIRWADESVEDLRSVNRIANLVFPLANKAEAYNTLGKYAEGLAAGKEGYAIMLETHQLNPLEVYYENFAISYEGLGNFKEASYWWKKFTVLDDSLFKEENVRTIADMETRYQTQKKETEIANQKLQIESQHNRLLRQQIWIGSLFFGIIALAIGAWLFYNRYRLRQQVLLNQAVIREQQLGLNAVIEAQENERRRIAKDLHDGIAQELVALNLQLRAIEYSVGKTQPELSPRVGEISQQLTGTCEEVRNLAHIMLPPALESQGLAGSLELLLRNSLTRNGLEAKLECKLPGRFDMKVELGLYRIAQELINNIIKHARAAQVKVQLFHQENLLVLRVEDDGQGFDFEQARKKGSMGLLNILSRVSTLGGEFSSAPRTPHGTVSTITIPLIA